MPMPARQPDDLLNTSNAAKILDLSVDQIRKLDSQGRLASVRTGLGHRLFKRSDVEKLKAERAKNPPQRGRPSKKKTRKVTKKAATKRSTKTKP